MSILAKILSIISGRGTSSTARPGSHRVSSHLRGRPHGGTSFVRQYLRQNRR